MASAKAEVTSVQLFPRPGQPQQPPPGVIPEPETRYALVAYRFIDSGVQAAIPFDDWQNAPTVGQILELSAAVVPTLNRFSDARIGSEEWPPVKNQIIEAANAHNQERQLSQR